MKVSILICTWNRCDLLKKVLNHIEQLIIPKETDWEVLVVNNRCTDRTDDVIASFSARLPIHRLFEDKQGVNNALNYAIESSSGELILRTDDDTFVDPSWLRSYVEAACRWPKAAYFGGIIDPLYEVSPPVWFAENSNKLAGITVKLNLGETERPVRHDEELWGPNIAFRRFVFNEGRRFNPNLGPCANDRIRDGEVTFMHELNGCGFQGIWVPSAKVRHYVPARALTRNYLWRDYQGRGRTAIRKNEVKEKLCFGYPIELYKKYWQQLLTYYCRRLKNQSAWVLPYIKAAKLNGMLYEYKLQKKDIK